MQIKLYELKNMFVGKQVRIRFNDRDTGGLVGECTDIIEQSEGCFTKFGIVFEGYLHLGFNADVCGEDFVEGLSGADRQRLDVYTGTPPTEVFAPPL